MNIEATMYSSGDDKGKYDKKQPFYMCNLKEKGSLYICRNR